MLGGRGARFFFGMSAGIVLESYGGECMFIPLMLIGLAFLLMGEPGALTVEAFRKQNIILHLHTEISQSHVQTFEWQVHF